MTGPFEVSSYEAFVSRVTEPNATTHLVALSDRPGIASFHAFIEYNWFPPNTIRNSLFFLELVVWETLHWTVVSIPTNKMGGIRNLASLLRLRIANGVPTIIGGIPESGDRVFEGHAVHFFPGSSMPDGKDNPRMFSVESAPHNPLHNKEYRLRRELVLERENLVLDAFERRKFPKPLEIYNFIYGFEPHPSWLS